MALKTGCFSIASPRHRSKPHSGWQRRRQLTPSLPTPHTHPASTLIKQPGDPLPHLESPDTIGLAPSTEAKLLFRLLKPSKQTYFKKKKKSRIWSQWKHSFPAGWLLQVAHHIGISQAPRNTGNRDNSGEGRESAPKAVCPKTWRTCSPLRICTPPPHMCLQHKHGLVPCHQSQAGPFSHSEGASDTRGGSSTGKAIIK